jgi:hypothetical protein
LSHLERNLAALGGPGPANAVRGLLDRTLSLSLEQTRSGDHTARIAGESGEEVYLHSRYDPRKEAKGLIDSGRIANVGTYVLMGLGLGYHLKELLDRTSAESYVIVVERDASMLKAALDLHDYSGHLRRGKLLLAVSSDEDGIYQFLRAQVPTMFYSTQVIRIDHPASVAAFPSFYDGARRVFLDVLKSGQVGIRTALLLSKSTSENRFLNLPDYVLSPGVKTFKDRFKGFPAIVVSAGPSLARNIELLAQAKGKAVIVAVSTALKALLARGITPDFACLLDYHGISKRYFDGDASRCGIPLVVDPRATNEAVRVYRGPKLFFDDSLLNLTLRDMRLSKGALEYGATVAHLAFCFSSFIGADPVILVGQDLSYPYNITHVPGTAIHGQWRPQVNRFNTFEMKEWEFFISHKKLLMRIKDVNGNDVYTDESMFSYLKEFGGLCAMSGKDCINATEGGAAIAATRHVRLADALAEFCRDPIPPGHFLLGEEGSGRAAETLRMASDGIRGRLRECSEIRKLYDEFERLLMQVQQTLDAGGDADPIVVEILGLKQKLTRFEELHMMLMELTTADEMMRLQWDRRIRAGGKQGREKQREQADRDLTYVRALRGAVKVCVEMLEKGAGRLSECLEGMQV